MSVHSMSVCCLCMVGLPKVRTLLRNTLATGRITPCCWQWIDSLGRVVGSVLKVGAIKKADFALFVQSLELGKSSLLLLDNAAIHKKLYSQAQYDSEDMPEFCFVPPYTPELNPIETVFHSLKTKVRKAALDRTLRKSTVAADVQTCLQQLEATVIQNAFAKVVSLAETDTAGA